MDTDAGGLRCSLVCCFLHQPFHPQRGRVFVRKARWSPVCAPPLGGDPWRSPFFVLVPDYPRYWLSPLGFSLLQRHEHLLLGSSSPLAASSPSGWLPEVLRGRSVFRPSQRVCSRRSCSRALVMLDCPTIRCSQPLPAPRSAVADLWRSPMKEPDAIHLHRDLRRQLSPRESTRLARVG